MKRKCKNKDITDKQYIKSCIIHCMHNKRRKAWERADIKAYWLSHDNDIDKIVDELSDEIKNRTVDFPRPKKRNVNDRSNGKERDLTIEHIKNQYYNYIAKEALDELLPKIGNYQIACQEGKGPVWGSRVILGWLKDKRIRYAVKADVKKCYPSITHANMLKWLEKRVKNDDLLYLIKAILDRMDEGLPIGSYLSITLCALYLSSLYHHISESYFKQRRGKSINMVSHVMFFLDDIYIFGTSAKDLHKVINGSAEYAKNELGITIKPSWNIINLNPDDKHAHIDCMGYRIYRDHITMRRRNYEKVRRIFKAYQRCKTVKRARSVTAFHGLFIQFTNSFRFRKKYNVKALFRKARKEVSKHDKSNIQRNTATDTDIPYLGNSDSVPTLLT